MRLLPFLLILALVSTSQAQTQAPASAAGLAPKDEARLRSLQSRITIPTYIPKGFHLDKVEVTLDKRFGNSYSLRYLGPNQGSFAVEMATGGIGDVPDGDKHYPFKTSLFGAGTLEWSAPNKEDPKSHLNTGWMSETPGKMPVYQVNGDDLIPQEAIKIAQSLRYLK